MKLEVYVHHEGATVCLVLSGKAIARMTQGTTIAQRIEYAEHIAACVNACSGLNPEGIPGLIEVAEVCAAASKWDNRLAPFYCEKVLQDALASVKEKP